MRYLYFIFRLFKCPHKYNILKGEAVYKRKRLKAYKYFLQCKRCGNIKKTIKKV